MNFEYRVLSGASARSLEEQVIDLCVNEGFIPQGGVAVTYMGRLKVNDPDDTIAEILYTQAVVKVSAKK